MLTARVSAQLARPRFSHPGQKNLKEVHTATHAFITIYRSLVDQIAISSGTFGTKFLASDPLCSKRAESADMTQVGAACLGLKI